MSWRRLSHDYVIPASARCRLLLQLVLALQGLRGQARYRPSLLLLRLLLLRLSLLRLSLLLLLLAGQAASGAGAGRNIEAAPKGWLPQPQPPCGIFHVPCCCASRAARASRQTKRGATSELGA